MNIKQIDFSKNHNHIRHELLWIAMQEEQKGRILLTIQDHEGSSRYEVWLTRYSKPHPLSDQSYDLVECAPSSAQWGVRGWTYLNLSDAKDKMHSLIPKVEEVVV